VLRSSRRLAELHAAPPDCTVYMVSESGGKNWTTRANATGKAIDTGWKLEQP
jgi:hypothetical protein